MFRTNNEIPMPSFSPVRIPTRGLPWFKKILASFSRRRWKMDHDYYLFLPWLQKTIMIPKDFVFDGASVPRIFWPIIDPVGVLLIGSLFHDFGYGYNHFLDESGKIIYEGAGRSFFDDQIRKINIYINEPVILNDIVWFVLVLFGWITWNTRRKTKRNVYQDFPDLVKN